MYFGTAETVLDDKHRITVPRRVRATMDVLGHAVWYMARGFDHAVAMFPKEEWDNIRRQVNRFSSMDARALDFRRLLFASATEVRPDRQGRMAVPPHLRDYAGLDREAVLIGVDDHLELWSRDAWREFEAEQAPGYKAMAAPLFVGDSDREKQQNSTEEGGVSHET